MIVQADALNIPLADRSVQCVVTSPPYYALRDYGVNGQLGLEKTPEEYVENMVCVFREVRRVLRDDGTLWLNLGDSYAGGGRGVNDSYLSKKSAHSQIDRSKRKSERYGGGNIPATGLLKPKDLIGIPWMVAFALRADGWYLRSEIIWNKLNPMPESCNDRPTKSHEQLFLLTKRPQYFYDSEAIKEDAKYSNEERYARAKAGQKSNPNELVNGIRVRKPAGWDTSRQGAHGAFHREGRSEDVEYTTTHSPTRNKRDVWSIATQPFRGAHFATYPEDLITPCILAGTSQVGQCPVCGSPWERIIGKGKLISIDGTKDDYRPVKNTDDPLVKGRSEG